MFFTYLSPPQYIHSSQVHTTEHTETLCTQSRLQTEITRKAVSTVSALCVHVKYCVLCLLRCTGVWVSVKEIPGAARPVYILGSLTLLYAQTVL